MTSGRLLTLASLTILFGSVQAEAAKVKVWHHFLAENYEKARFNSAVVSSEGVLRLSRQVKSLADIKAMHVWDVIEDRAGNLIVATGDEGKLFKVAPAGKVELLHASKESQVFCLAQAPDGSIYAGTGPGGKILKIDVEGKVSVLARELDSYVWSLVYDADRKALFAGTGPKGRIFQVQENGKHSVFYSAKQEHILCLALDGKGHLVAGTDKGGTIHRIDAKGKGFVVFHTPQNEIRSLLVTADAIYAGTGAPVTRKSGGSTKNSSAALEADDTIFVAQTKDSSDSRPGASAGPAPSTGENSIFRISPDGMVREVFRDKVLVLSMLKLGPRLLVGTGLHGQLFEVDIASKEKAEIARLDNSEIHCLRRRKDGSIVVGTGDAGKLFVLEDRYAAKGTVISEVLDAKIISKWGALTWKCTTPPEATVSLAVRSGNVPEPDATWSDWSAEQSDPAQAKVLAPPARYLQYRVSLASSKADVTPLVRTITLRYQTTNQPPEITAFTVPDLDGDNLENPSKLKLKWTATDPNEDELIFKLYLKKEGWKDWVLMEDNLDKKTYDWDTTAVPAGLYRLKLVASDRNDNPPAEALLVERLSAPVPVAHEPPSVTLKLTGFEGGQAHFEGSAADPLVRLTEASFAINGKRWTSVFPTDGLFDSKQEAFRFKTPALQQGTYVLVLRARNAAGSTGAADVVFTVPNK